MAGAADPLTGCFEQLHATLAAATPVSRALAARWEELWGSRSPAASVCAEIAACDEYWACLLSGDPDLLDAGVLSLAAVCLHHGFDGRAALALKLAIATGSSEIRETLTAVLDGERREIEASLQPGMRLHDEGRYEEAIALYDAVIARRPWGLPLYERALSLRAVDPRSDWRGLYAPVLVCDPLFPQTVNVRGEYALDVYQWQVLPLWRSRGPTAAEIAHFAQGAAQLHEPWSAANALAILHHAHQLTDPQPMNSALEALGVGPRLDPERTSMVAVAVAQAREEALALRAAAEHAMSEIGGGDVLEPVLRSGAAWDALPDATVVERAGTYHLAALAFMRCGDHIAARRRLRAATALLATSEGTHVDHETTVALTAASVETTLGNIWRASMLLAAVERGAGDPPSAHDVFRARRARELRAAMDRDAGDLASAAGALRDVLAADQADLGANAPELLTTETMLGSILIELDEHDAAGELLKHAFEVAGPEGGLPLASVLASSALLASRTGHLDDAVAQYERAASIERASSAVGDLRLRRVLRGLGVARARRGETSAAAELLAEVAERDFRASAVTAGMPESDRRRMARMGRRGRDALVTLALDAAPGDPVRDRALEAMVNLKALTSGIGARRATGPARSPSGVRPLRNTAALLAAMSLRGPQQLDPDAFVSQYFTRDERLENDLVRADAAGFTSALDYLRIAQLRSALPASSALVDITTITVGAPDADSMLPAPTTGPEHYVATVLTPDGIVAMVSLGMVEEIDALVRRFRTELALYIALPAISTVRDAAGRTMWTTCRALYDATLAPLAAPLAAVERVALLLDAGLGLVPFACLAMPEGGFAIERWLFSSLAVAHDLVETPAPTDRDDVVAFVDPDFGTAPVAEAPTAGSAPLSEALRAPWRRLAGTRTEAEALARCVPPTRLRTLAGESASKTALNAVEHPMVLHLATHGFYIGEDRVLVLNDLNGGGPDAIRAGAELRSGLVLAGANARRTLHYLAPDDGIVTALELALVDLAGTQLVVVNACESAVGDALAGDVVHGVRRACHLAGARTVLSCLWTVADDDAAALTGGLYDRLRAGDGVAPALRAAMLERIAANATESDVPLHPFHWAAWSLSGGLAAGLESIALA